MLLKSQLWAFDGIPLLCNEVPWHRLDTLMPVHPVDHYSMAMLLCQCALETRPSLEVFVLSLVFDSLRPAQDYGPVHSVEQITV